ncbi:MAG: OmpH family outer membrane protein [Deltaproteobacteria bacterium]|nr:OmpH family outer membrane protein [Deltaproteobacteria bacterium]MCX7953218.1 OmpH family outer membrane protein [Deltaproteobacteria bacterium]
MRFFISFNPLRAYMWAIYKRFILFVAVFAFSACEYRLENKKRETNPPEIHGSIAFIDLGKIQSNSSIGKELIEVSRMASKELESLRNSLAEKISKEAEELKKMSVTISQDALRAKMKELDQKKSQAEEELRNKRKSLEQFVEGKRVRFLETVKEIVKKLAEERGYSAVFDTSFSVHFLPNLDISDEVIAQLNALHRNEKEPISSK